MASKGKNVKLQNEVNSTEDLVIFLNQYSDILLILDVYNEWFGPCKSMVSCLKKAKNESDIIQLAIVNCDNVDVLRRFKNRSEPVWLFIYNGKVINSFFGCNIPAMVQLIRNEVEFCKSSEGKSSRRKFELSEMTSIEVNIHKEKKLKEIMKKRDDAGTAALKAREYIDNVIGKIMSHAGESGVTIFMPHVTSRDLYKKLLEIGENMRLTARASRTAVITAEHLKIINWERVNLPQVLFDHINGKEVFMVCWKISDEEEKPTETIMNEFKDLVTERRTKMRNNGDQVQETEEEDEPETGLILKSLSIILEQKCVEKCIDTFVRLSSINVELIEDELEFIRYVIEFSIDYASNNGVDSGKANYLRTKLSRTLNISENDERFTVAVEMLDTLISDVTADQDADFDNDDSQDADATEKVNNVPDAEDSADEIFYDTDDPKKAHIPPVWTPKNKKANAALIYLYFRVLTEHFLPPDPVVEPPHVAIAFDANKMAEVNETAKPYGKDVLLYGYFDSTDWTKAKLLAASHSEYKKLLPNSKDKLVLKVKESSDAVLMLTGLMPDYVSQDYTQGKIECQHFFPDGYQNAEIEIEDANGEGSDKEIENH